MENVKIYEKTAFYAILFTLSLSLVKFVGYLISKNQILLADSLHSLIDVVPALFAYISLKIASIKTKKFPYGLYKAENLATLFISLFILSASYEIIVKFKPNFNTNSIIFAAMAFILTGLYALFLKKKSKGSIALEAIYKESLGDVLSSFVILLALFLKNQLLQKIIVYIIGLFLIKAGLEAFFTAILGLLDISPSEKEIEKILNKIKEENLEILDYKFRKSGNYILGEVKIKIPKNMNAIEINNLIDKIREKLDENISIVFDITSEKIEKIAIPLKNNKINEDFAGTDEFLIFDLKKDKKTIVKNPHKDAKIRKGAKIAEFLNSLGIDAVITKNIGTIAFNSLKSKGILIYKAENEKIDENIEKLKKNKLKEITKETKVKL